MAAILADSSHGVVGMIASRRMRTAQPEKRVRRAPLLAAPFVLAAMLAVASAQQPAMQEWLVFGGDSEATHYSPLVDVNRESDRKSTRLNSSHIPLSRIPSS